MANTVEFNAEKTTNELIAWIREWFDKNGKGCNAVIGISGGKDSSVTAALCAKALGKDRVIGVMMPNGTQKDIADSKKLVEFLGIRNYTVDISTAVAPLLNEIGSCGDFELTEQTKINISPRIRMVTLYAVSQSNNGRVINTCNLSENICGFSTLYGDHAGDMSVFDQLTVTEIRQIGHYLGLPADLVDKVPSDGLTGRSDEDNYGFSYTVLDKYIRTGECDDPEIKEKINTRYRNSKFKLDIIQFPHFESGLPICVE